MLYHVVLYQKLLFKANPENPHKACHDESKLYPVLFDKFFVNLPVVFFVFSKWSTSTIHKLRLS